MQVSALHPDAVTKADHEQFRVWVQRMIEVAEVSLIEASSPHQMFRLDDHLNLRVDGSTSSLQQPRGFRNIASLAETGRRVKSLAGCTRTARAARQHG